MIKKENKQSSIKKIKSIQKKNSLTSKFIILTIAIFYLFLESISIILHGFKKGFFKKEILSKKTNLGFDLIIKRK